MDFVEVEHYDPFSNCWTPTGPALKYVTNFTASSCEGKLYLIGSCAVKYNALTMQCYNPVIGKKQHTSTCITSQVSVKTNHICHIRASSGLELVIQNNFMKRFKRVFTHVMEPANIEAQFNNMLSEYTFVNEVSLLQQIAGVLSALLLFLNIYLLPALSLWMESFTS